MKSIIKQLIALFLCIILFCNSSIPVHAKMPSDIPMPADPGNPTQEEIEALEEYLLGNNNRWKQFEDNFWTYIMSQTGALWNGDLEQIKDNDEYLNKLNDSTWRKENISVRTNKDGKLEMVVKKSVSDALLNIAKEATKEPDNGGYELVKTVPLSKISTLYFNSPYDYRTVVNLINDNDGMIGLRTLYGRAHFYKVHTDAYYVRQLERELTNSDTRKKFSPFGLYSVC